ncbi:MAG: hypothetical protein WEB37_09775 [Bacteroidota bacterium]
MIILTLANGKAVDASSPIHMLGEMNPKEIVDVSYTQKTEKNSAESWVKSLNDKFKKNLMAKQVDSGKGKQPFDSPEKKILYGVEVGKLLDQVRPLVDKVNEAIGKAHGHTLKLYFDYTNGKNHQSN